VPNADPLRLRIFKEALDSPRPGGADFRNFLWEKYREAGGHDSFEGWVKDRSDAAREALVEEYANTKWPPTPDQSLPQEQFPVDELFEKCAGLTRPDFPIAGEFHDFLLQEYGRQGPLLVAFEEWVAFSSPRDRLRLYEAFTNRPTGRRGDGATPPTLAEKLGVAEELRKLEKRSQEMSEKQGKGGFPPGMLASLSGRNSVPINFERYGVTKDPKDPKDAFAGTKTQAAKELYREAVTERRPASRSPASYEDYAKTNVGQFVTAFARRFLGAPFAPGTQRGVEFHAYVDKVLAALYDQWAKTPARGFLWYVVERYRRMFMAADRYLTYRLRQALDDVGIRAPVSELGRDALLHFRTLRYLCDEPLNFDMAWDAGESRQLFPIPPHVGSKSGIPAALWEHPCGWWVRVALDPSKDTTLLAPLLGFPSEFFLEAGGKAPTGGDDEDDEEDDDEDGVATREEEAPAILLARHLDEFEASEAGKVAFLYIRDVIRAPYSSTGDVDPYARQVLRTVFAEWFDSGTSCGLLEFFADKYLDLASAVDPPRGAEGVGLGLFVHDRVLQRIHVGWPAVPRTANQEPASMPGWWRWHNPVHARVARALSVVACGDRGSRVLEWAKTHSIVDQKAVITAFCRPPVPHLQEILKFDDEQLAKELEDYFWEGSPAGARAAYEKGVGRPRKRGARPDEGMVVPPLTSEAIKAALEKMGVAGEVLTVEGGSAKWVDLASTDGPAPSEQDARPPWERDELGFALRMGATELLSARLSKHLGLPEGELPRAFSLLVLGAVFSLAEGSGLIESRPVLKRAIGELTPALNVWAAALGTSSAARIALEAFQGPEVADSIEWFRIEVDEASSTSAPAEPSEEPATAVPAGERAARG
jgi:hypothetical protein